MDSTIGHSILSGTLHMFCTEKQKIHNHNSFMTIILQNGTFRGIIFRNGNNFNSYYISSFFECFSVVNSTSLHITIYEIKRTCKGFTCNLDNRCLLLLLGPVECGIKSRYYAKNDESISKLSSPAALLFKKLCLTLVPQDLAMEAPSHAMHAWLNNYI